MGDEQRGAQLKRRGILAGVAALVAGWQTPARSAEATHGGADATNALHIGQTNTSTAETVVNHNPAFNVGVLRVNSPTSGIAVLVNAPNPFAGGYGLYGETNAHEFAGLRGHGTGTGTGGVFGTATGPNGPGVSGTAAGAGGDGVRGRSTSGYGVFGISTNNNGVYGATNGAAGQAGVAGVSNNTFAVSGVATNYTGILGQTQGGGYGVAGIASHPNSLAGVFGRADANFVYGVRGQAAYTAILGESTGAGNLGGFGVAGLSVASAGVYARSTAASSYALVASSTTGLAGLFDGSVLVQGNLTVLGSVSSAAPHPQADGGYRRAYALESSQGWAEEFGEGRLVDGRAVVPVPPALAQVADLARYHVFLTPHDPETETLAVTARHPDRFEIVEHGKGASTATFSYRIVAARRVAPGASADRVPVPQVPPPPAPKPVDLVLPAPPELPAPPSPSAPPGR
jgi:hypothetical protein